MVTLKPSQTFTRILYIEDDSSYSKLVGLYLEEMGISNYEFTHVSTLAQGLDILGNDTTTNVLLLDLNLPDSEGLSTLKTVLNKYPNQNVIVVTGASDKAMGLQAVQAGAQDYLVKGEFDEKLLSKSLMFSIERSQILTRLEEAQRIAKTGNWEYKPEQGYFYASDVAFKILGITTPEADTLIEEVRNTTSPLYIFEEISELARSRKKVRKEKTIHLQNKKQRHLLINCEAALTSAGEYVFSGIIQDITTQKRSEELRKAKDVAEESAKVKEQIFANVSHEMRTPMNAILGMANLLHQTTLTQEQKEYVSIIQQSSQDLLELISDILEVSSIQNKKLFFNEKEFCLRDVLQNLSTVFGPRSKEKNLDFSVVIDPVIEWQIIGDDMRLKQVLYNLIDNAFKFTDEGSIKVEVKAVDVSRDVCKLRFWVKDTGIGIEKNQKMHIFEAFNRILPKERNPKGTGLGLSIVKNIIENQGGVVGVNSIPNRGSDFFFELSFGRGSSIIDNKAATAPIDTNSQEIAFDILIVEDHQMNQLVMQKTIEKNWSKANVLISNTGDDAIELLKTTDVDIILMDIQMPGRDGFETTEYIRNNMRPEIANIPILAMTAWQYGGNKDDYRKFGLDDYILKPFDPQQLFEKITYFLEK